MHLLTHETLRGTMTTGHRWPGGKAITVIPYFRGLQKWSLTVRCNLVSFTWHPLFRGPCHSARNTVYIYIYIYIYIVFYRQTISLHHNSTVWLDTWDAPSQDRKPANFKIYIYIYICVCVCVYVCVYVYVCVWMHTYIYIYVCVCVSVYMYIYKCVYIYIYIYIIIYTHIYIGINIYTICIWIYIYIYIYIYIFSKSILYVVSYSK